MNKLQQWIEYGQSYWLDNLTRKKITGGELETRVKDQGLRGITSNPSIFNKAITNSNDYDDHTRELVHQQASPQKIYEELTVKDVQDACDILKPVYDSSDGVDGFVSLEVSPYLARDTEGTISEARRLFKKVNRENCFIKIPGTPEGLPAIEQMLYEGVNINITLLFSVDRYVEVAETYLKAMGRRQQEGLSLKDVRSVASVFLSRIDVLVDQLLGHKIVPSDHQSDLRPEDLFGQAGIATAKVAYQRFKEIFSGEKWEKLYESGAKVQRPLWASTSTKNPLYSDIRYVESIIAKQTVNTLPDKTIDAFAGHGTLREDTIEEHANEAGKVFDQLKQLGIDINFVTQQLENEGIQKFIDPYDKLMVSIAEKRIKMMGRDHATLSFELGKMESMISNAFSAMNEKQVARRISDRDPFLWKSDSENVKSISNRLGWLDLPKHFMEKVDEITGFSKTIKDAGYKHAVLLGMGGSSLSSEVAVETFKGKGDYPDLHVLDNTDPAAIGKIEKKIGKEKTLFIVASKSGTTTETLSFFKYFYQQEKNQLNGDTGSHFIAITDEGTPLVQTANDHGFRNVFINPGDVGGRYSVLSYFGLIPMALMGVNIKAMLASANQMVNDCNPYVPAPANPGLALGTIMGMCQQQGRDKITFILSESIAAFGLWVEQLIAESTGKEGKGLVPVVNNPVGSPEVYGNDRLFIYMHVPSDKDDKQDKKVKALADAGHPVVRISVPDKHALGGEYFRWEYATAVSGVVMKLNAFNEPNVAESKKNSKDLLAEWQKNQSFAVTTPLASEGEINVYGSDRTMKELGSEDKNLEKAISEFAGTAQTGDYIAILPYFLKKDKRTKILQALREQLRNEKKVAVTLLHGPRYLHSTGQLHKGGPNKGLYLLFTADDEEDLAIPDEEYGFGTLQHAQALGDFRSLNDKDRRVLRIDLGARLDENLKTLWNALKYSKEELKHQEV